MKTIYLVLTFCIGLAIGYFLSSDSETAIISNPVKPDIVAKANLIDSVKLNSDSTLLKRNALLSGQLKIATTLLKTAKISLVAERKKIAGLTQTVSNDTVPCKDSELVDSLVRRMDKLNAITDTMFAIYDNKVKLNEDLIAVRDSELFVCNHSYTQMKYLVKEQALREIQLTEDINRLLKQQKKKKFQNRLIAAGMLFISGVATTLIIRSKQ